MKTRGGFIHQTLAANSALTRTWMDTGLLNNRSGALMLVTPIWNPYGLGSGVYVNSPLEVMYDSSRNQWAIFTPSWNVVPNANFNVYPFSEYWGEMPFQGSGSGYSMEAIVLRYEHPVWNALS